MTNSILQNRKECALCRRELELWYMPWLPLPSEGLERHHVMHGTANRSKAEKWGMWVWLCHKHHTEGKDAVHQNREMDLALIRMGQRVFEGKYDHATWMREFGKNYLDEGER